jgi:AAA15 family ATPase/GTPase
MYISKLQLTNFKRFSDLTIDLSGLETPPRLVLLIGANGSGKSSVFDAFELLTPRPDNGFRPQEYYFFKERNQEYHIDLSFDNGYGLEFHGYSGLKNTGNIVGNVFYGRSALRQVPFLRYNQNRNIQDTLQNDLDRPTNYAARDFRLYADVDIVSLRLLDSFTTQKDRVAGEILAEFRKPLNDAFVRIFGQNGATVLELDTLNLSANNQGAEVYFRKGESRYHYNLLSTGEKEVFNVLLNIFVRRANYQNTVYFIDELDLHLNTSLQKSLILEIVENWLPANCQLWTASHSLGFIEYANESYEAVIIDLDNLDFDKPHTLTPAPKAGYETFEIAVPSASLAALLSDKCIVFAERTNAELYNALNITDYVFVDAVDRNDVFFRTQTPPYEGLADRDFLTDYEKDEITSLHNRFYLLEYYCFENYLYHPDNLTEYFDRQGIDFDVSAYRTAIVQEKNNYQSYIALGLHRSRDSYPYFKEKEAEKRRKEFRENAAAILEMLQSDDFETFYKVFSMKDYCGSIRPQNIRPIDLVSTNWFKTQIQNILERK